MTNWIARVGLIFAVITIFILLGWTLILPRLFTEVNEIDIYSDFNTQEINWSLKTWGEFEPPVIESKKLYSDDRIRKLSTEVIFTDNIFDTVWTVPEGAVVDGASIPRVFWPIIGSPFTGPYEAASYVHDFYCDTKQRSWREVHLAFYTAMRAAGVRSTKAKTMWGAVRYFGPRWMSLNENGECIADCNDPIPEPAQYNESWFVGYVDWIKRHESDAVSSWSPDIFDLESLALLCDAAKDGLGSNAHRLLLERDRILLHPNLAKFPLAISGRTGFNFRFLREFGELGCPQGNILEVYDFDEIRIKPLP